MMLPDGTSADMNTQPLTSVDADAGALCQLRYSADTAAWLVHEKNAVVEMGGGSGRLANGCLRQRRR